MERRVDAEEDPAQRGEGRADRGEGRRSARRRPGRSPVSRSGVSQTFSAVLMRSLPRRIAASACQSAQPGPDQASCYDTFHVSRAGVCLVGRARTTTAGSADRRAGGRPGVARRLRRASRGRAAPRTRPRPAPRARAPRRRPRAAGGARTARRSTASRPGARPRARRERPRPRCSARAARPSRRAASRKMAGSGLPRPTSSAETTTSEVPAERRERLEHRVDVRAGGGGGQGLPPAGLAQALEPLERARQELEALLAQEAPVGLLLGLAHALDPLRLDPRAEQLVQDLVVALAERVSRSRPASPSGRRRRACRARRSSGGRPSRSGCRPGPRARRRPSPMSTLIRRGYQGRASRPE